MYKAISAVQPEDTRPFAQYLKWEVKNPDIPSLSYNVRLYRQQGHGFRTPLVSPGDQEYIKVTIRQTQQFKHLVGLACFYYVNSRKKNLNLHANFQK